MVLVSRESALPARRPAIASVCSLLAKGSIQGVADGRRSAHRFRLSLQKLYALRRAPVKKLATRSAPIHLAHAFLQRGPRRSRVGLGQLTVFFRKLFSLFLVLVNVTILAAHPATGGVHASEKPVFRLAFFPAYPAAQQSA